MPSFSEKLNDWLVPAALGAMLYFMQAIAHDSQEMARSAAVANRRLDEYERRITTLEDRGQVYGHEERKPGSRPH